MRSIVRLVAVLSALSLAGAGSAFARGAVLDRGVVQSVSTTRIVLRELDGRTIEIVVGPLTRVLVNGGPAALLDVQPGFVAAVRHDGSAPARVIRAFGRLQQLVDRGVVVSMAPRRLVIRRVAGDMLSFRVTFRTRFRWRGLAATAAAVRPGRVVDVSHTPGGVAVRVAVRKPRAA
jgi:hypothetical protein